MELMRNDMHSELNYLLGNCDYSEVTGKRLMKFCCHVSLGLRYMETVKVIHRDIASRNVLISNDDVAKIGDFGSAKDVYETLTYKESPSKQGQKVPVGWMAPESLLDGVYTHMSDMWSYGVFLWEAATLGGTPYHNINSADIPQRLQEGHRLPKPQHCSEEFYNLMLRCWTMNPQERLTASKAVDILETLTREDRGIFHV
ncbi:fibroblast growth factor receptor 3-like [Ptychodera flava]|uniref:fibroblast growth factor receptor 3-like n=1 Tax=Ptychodera flava TaxID=63121 RepID=UPI00396A7E7A